MTTINSWEIPSNAADDYGVRIRGYVIPPVTGDYVFYLTSDDHSGLYLSTDESPENRRRIAYVDSWREPRKWVTWKLETTSSPIRLEAGKRYYVETLYKEGTGNDYLGVNWLMPGLKPPERDTPGIPGEYLAPLP